MRAQSPRVGAMPAAYDEVAMTRINLPTHPLSGLTPAIGLRRNGTPIFPVMGGDGTTPPPVPPAPPAVPPAIRQPRPHRPQTSRSAPPGSGAAGRA